MEWTLLSGVHCSLFAFDFPFLIFHVTLNLSGTARSEMRNKK